jgi:uncharacterized protein YerC
MKNKVKVIFTKTDVGGYYIEEVTTDSMLEIQKRWDVGKVIDETTNYRNYQEVEKELGNSTIGEYKQFVVIQNLNNE